MGLFSRAKLIDDSQLDTELTWYVKTILKEKDTLVPFYIRNIRSYDKPTMTAFLAGAKRWIKTATHLTKEERQRMQNIIYTLDNKAGKLQQIA